MYIQLHSFEKEEIVLYLRDNTCIPLRFGTKDQKRRFKDRAKKFYFTENPFVFKYKVGLDRYLRFYTIEEYEAKTDFIKLTVVHTTNQL